MTPATARPQPAAAGFGLIVHPPMLYMGYVGFSVAFAFAIAALLSGRLDAAWARWSRPWTNVAWAFLTLGISPGQLVGLLRAGLGWLVVLGSGGERQLHALAGGHGARAFPGRLRETRHVQELDPAAGNHTFSLSLLGAFIVRSGVLTSVHAFAVDPSVACSFSDFCLVRGRLADAVRAAASSIRSVGSRWRAGKLSAPEQHPADDQPWRWCCSARSTRWPTRWSAVGKISVGVPYFNAGFVPLMLLLAAALGVAPALNWKRTRGDRVFSELRWVGCGAASTRGRHTPG